MNKKLESHAFLADSPDTDVTIWVTPLAPAIGEVAKLEAENEVLREYAVHKKDCEVWNQTVRYFHDGEHDICDCGLDALLTGVDDD